MCLQVDPENRYIEIPRSVEKIRTYYDNLGYFQNSVHHLKVIGIVDPKLEGFSISSVFYKVEKSVELLKFHFDTIKKHF